jgi:hypothetical protein
MDLGRKATFRAAKTLARSPPLAPAEQWCARMIVLSIICRLGLPPPAFVEGFEQQLPQARQRPAPELAVNR